MSILTTPKPKLTPLISTPSSSPPTLWPLLRYLTTTRTPALLMTTLLFLFLAPIVPASPTTKIVSRFDTNHGNHDVFTVGSPCVPEMEGIWNCMVSQWQRCAQGRWSVVMPCKDGTVCAPVGVSFAMKVAAEGPQNGGNGAMSRGQDGGDRPPATAAGSGWGGPGGMGHGGWGWSNAAQRVRGESVRVGWVCGMVVTWMVVGGGLF
ncbi:hypothetical protein QBC34DRAFT_459940 [Podospora aff. communis PSN243]|uniref:Uncharacterized protein n=1 Tax=Podospora aff. communis PSN243 TaxID=3040156 RepID=A0AAV9GTA4_9PEZI|nr:hypothetical protein QBC34DRAFT_459940 [Podospora aff. communis PSN243]